MRFWTILFLLLAEFSVLAETIYGKITDEKTGIPIENAVISINDKSVFSKTNGDFVISDIKTGKHLIMVKRIGYQTLQKTISVPLQKALHITLKAESILMENFVIEESRAIHRDTPVTFSNMDKETIAQKNFGQDIPMLLSDLPNVFAYSDAGNGIGYSNLKVRGFDQKRIGVQINGIPLNDPEDHQVYWVDMPDFAESISDIQFQRGVGSSIYGISSFGGSLNLRTNFISEPEQIELYSNYGSYKTYKAGLNGTFHLTKKIKCNLRFSKIESDGFRDRSETDLWSYFANITRLGKRSIWEVNIYGGKEITHAAWDASPESILKENHQHNPYDYYNEIDEFEQPHYELHHRYAFHDRLDLKNTLFYIHGKGFYNQLKESINLWEYGLSDDPEDSLSPTIIRQKWVQKNQYGWVGQMNWQHPRGNLTFGSYVSLFDSDHWGEVDSLSIELENFHQNFKYHQYTGEKLYATGFVQENFRFNDAINVMLNLYFQHINYKMTQEEAGNFVGAYRNQYEVDYHFFNPRFGVNYNLDQHWNLYGNVSFSQREPTDNELFDTWYGADDLGISPLFAKADTVFTETGEIKLVQWEDPYVKEEELIDYELGLNYVRPSTELRLNFFWMDFTNEIVSYGGVDDEGYPIRGNAEKSVHRGVEFSVDQALPFYFRLHGNISYNDNYFKTFVAHEYDENWDPIVSDYSGNTISGFPNWLASANLQYQIDRYRFSFQWKHVGKQYLDHTENEDRTIPAYELMNFSSSLIIGDLSYLQDIELMLQINNVLNKKYYTAGYFYGENYYWPGSGTNGSLGIRIKFFP